MTTPGYFGGSLAAAFAKESETSRFSEIAQFRALMRAFGTLKDNFAVEEFHGAKHQAYFNGQGAWARDPARCELCDLAILSYSTNGGFHGRLTFLQAKLDKDLTQAHVLLGLLGKKIEFKANLEQWDLLSRRPDILPVPPFVAPPELLSGAPLASVGSFGVFHRTDGKAAGMFYASADTLEPHGSPSTRYGKLLAKCSHPMDRTVAGYAERTYCPDMSSFGTALFDLEIGTPVEDAEGDDPGNAYRYGLRRWISRAVAAHAGDVQRDSLILNELLGTLPDPGDANEAQGSVPSFVVIRSDHRRREQRG